MTLILFPYDNTPDFYDQPPQPQYKTYLCELCGNDSHFGYDCPPRFPLVYEQEPSYNQNYSDNYYPQNSPSFPQQYLCCESCGGPHESFQCQPMNQNYFEPNPIYNSSYSGFDQPPQYSINHQEDLNQQRISDVHNGWDKIDELQNELLQMIQSFCEKFLQQKQAASIDQSPLQEMSLQEMEDLKQHYLDEMLSLSNDLGIKDYRNEKIDIRFRRECENMIDELKGKFNRMSIEINKKKELQQLKQAAKLSTYTTEPSQRFNFFFYDDDDDYDYEERSIPLRDIISKLPPSIAITPVLPTLEPEDSLIMGNEELSTIPEKESDEFIKSSVDDLVPITSESEDTSESDSDCDLPSYDNFSPINVSEEKSVTFSNPLFDSNNDFTSSDDESLSDKDVPKDNVKIYSNPLFEFDDEYISSDVNPLLDEMLKNIESKDSYVSNLDEPALLVTPLFDDNEDECFNPGGDEIEACLTSDSIPPRIDGADFDPEGDILLLEKLLNDDPLSPLPLKELYYEDLKVIQSSIDTSLDFEDDYYDSERDIIYLESLLNNDTIPYLPPEVFLDHDPNNLKDEPDLKSIVKLLTPGFMRKKSSLTYVSLTFEDRHYLSFTYVI
ncbi:hypothetical protein Tco_1314050 [Tanacetum coccineum]